jgi:pimeloyl-ACP methyl ester carboxylesterase
VAIDLRGVRVVVLPGTGSDDDYVRRAFGAPLHAAGASLIAPPPEPRRLVDGYLAALDDAARTGTIAVGGVSIGAAVSLTWALRHPEQVMAVLAALPAWAGEPGSSPAALAARYSAQQLREHGLTATTTQMRASSPPWLAEELTRSWLGQWPDLPDAMDEAAGYIAPNHAQLHGLATPMGVAAASDDPIHPLQVGREWAAAAPHAALRTITLDQLGAEPSALGAACLAALREL